MERSLLAAEEEGRRERRIRSRGKRDGFECILNVWAGSWPIRGRGSSGGLRSMRKYADSGFSRVLAVGEVELFPLPEEIQKR